MELIEQLLVRARPLTELAVGRGVGTQAEQVMHARRVVGDEGQVIVGAARAHVVGALPRLTPQNLLAIKTRGSRRHVRLQADDRLNTRILAVRVEIEGTEQVTMIRQADRRLPEARGLLRHRFRLRSSVEHRVLGVIVKVHEGISHASILLSEARARPTDAPRHAVVHLTASPGRDGAGLSSTPPAPTGQSWGCRSPSSAASRSAGYGLDTLIGIPVRGCANPRRTACNH